jgi:hypothetical protein
MVFEGTLIKCYVDNTLIISYTETDISRNTTGTIGLYVFSLTHNGWFDNIKVSEVNTPSSALDTFSGTLDSKWKMENQNYSFNSSTSASITDSKLNFNSNGLLYSYSGVDAYNWSDYTLSTEINLMPWAVNVNSCNIGIAGRMNSSGTGYRFFYNGVQNRFVLSYNAKETNYNHEWDATGYLTRIDNSIIPAANGASDLGIHNFKMSFVGNNIKCYVDNVMVINYTELDLAKNKKGTIGLYTYQHTHNTWFDNVKVTMLSGDSNFDGAINVADMTIIKMHLLRATSITKINALKNMDMSLDRKITISDLLAVKKRVLALD